MRNFRRWVSTAAMLFLAWVAVTGVLLAVDFAYPPAGVQGPGAVAPGNGDAALRNGVAPADATASGAVLPADIVGLAATSMHAALANTKDAVNTIDLQLQMQDGQPLGIVKLSGANDRTVSVDSLTGTVREITNVKKFTAAALGQTPWYSDMQTRVRLHNLLRSLHRGTIIGVSGQVMDMLTGLCFIMLSVTGPIMYFQMLKRRKLQGRPNWFWK